MGESLYQAQCRRDAVQNTTALSIKEFAADQRAFFDKALIAALHVASSIVKWPTDVLPTDIEEANYLADAAVTIALSLVKKRQAQFDNGEI